MSLFHVTLVDFRLANQRCPVQIEGDDTMTGVQYLKNGAEAGHLLSAFNYGVLLTAGAIISSVLCHSH